MEITTTYGEGVAFMEVSGEVDLSTCDQLREAGIAALSPLVGTLRIDLYGVSFLDSSGLAALIEIRNAAGTRHSVILQNPQPSVRRILQITALDQVFTIKDVESV